MFRFFGMLKTACNAYGRHCSSDSELNHNVFTRPSNTLPECVLDDKTQAFGSGTVIDHDGSEFLVEYEYQIQTTLSQNVVGLNDENDSALRRVENAMAQALVRSLFGGVSCTVSPVIKQLGNVRSRRRKLRPYFEQLSGFRSEPIDQVLLGSEGVTCQTDLVEDAARCFVVGGVFTLIGRDENTDFEWFGPASLLELKAIMERGEFNGVDADVVDVQFVNGNVTLPARGTLPPQVVGDIGDGVDDQISSTEAWPWVVLGIGVMVFFLIVFYMNRCAVKRQKRIEDDNQNLSQVAASSSVSSATASLQPSPNTKATKSEQKMRLDTVQENFSGDAASLESNSAIMS